MLFFIATIAMLRHCRLLLMPRFSLILIYAAPRRCFFAADTFDTLRCFRRHYFLMIFRHY